MTEFSRSQIEARLVGLDRPPSSPEVAELQRRMEGLVDGVMTIRRTLRPAAEALSACPPGDRERFLDSAGFVAATSLELAYNFCAFAIPAFRRMEPAAWPAWVLRILDLYDEGGTLAAITAMKEAAASAAPAQMRPGAVELHEVVRVLEGLLHGLQGRRLRIEAGEPPWTDTEVVHLPPVLARAEGRAANYRLFKALAVHQWAQVRYGTWSQAGLAELEQEAGSEEFLNVFHRLETERLDACIERDLPGLGRELAALRAGCAPLPRGWSGRLRAPAASAADSLALAREAAAAGWRAEPLPYQGVLRPGEVRVARERRIQREKTLFRKWLRHLLDQERKMSGSFGLRERDSDGETWRVELTLDGRPVAPPAELRALMDSVVLDLGQIPPEYLVPAGPGAWRPQERGTGAGAEPSAGETPFVYDEWDYQRQRYRKDWCRVREQPVVAREDGFVERTLRTYRPLLHRLHRGFEALREQHRRLRRQVQGDEVDLDALVEAWVQWNLGHELDERLFVQAHKRERDVAVLFMVDLSGSTEGWVNRLEREALVLLCEALERLGDRYAIYGFSGFTHRRCELYPVKRFDEPYDETVRGRIANLRPRDYTRMGAAIRHLTAVLGAVEARTRLLVTLSDGRPDDQDGYRGPYGIEDTRRALLEARSRGIHPFCITIDTEAQDYLPHMYGPRGYTIVDQIDRLPFRVSDVYRRLTA